MSNMMTARTRLKAGPLWSALLLVMFLIGDVAAQSRIKFEQDHVNFGKVTVGKKVTVDFRFSNSGDKTLKIHAIKSGCGCAEAKTWPKSLEPGDEAVGLIDLNTEELEGKVDRTVSLWTNDPNQGRVVLHILGEVWSPIELKPNYAFFRTTKSRDDTQSLSIKIRNKTEQKMAFTNVQSSNPKFTAEIVETSLGKQFELRIRKEPPLDFGFNLTKITAETTHPEMPTFSLKAQANVERPVEVSPRSIRLNLGKLNKPLKRYISVKDNMGGALVVSGVRVSIEGVKATLIPKSEKSGNRVLVEFPAGMMVGADSGGTLIVGTNHPEFPEVEVPITVYVPPGYQSN